MNQECEQVSFVGLGPLGLPMAVNLLHGLQGKMPCRIFDPLPERMEVLLSQGAIAAEQGTLAQPGSMVFTMIPDDRLLLQMSLGPDGLLKQLGTGGIQVALSTVSPHVALQLEKLYTKQSCTYLAAATLGYPDMAPTRDLVLCLAGDFAAKQRVRPLLSTMSNQIYDLGKAIERASIVHTAATTLVAVIIETLGEIAALGEACGMNRERFLRWVLASPVLRQWRDDESLIGKRTCGDAEARCSVVDALKEVELAIQMGQEQELDLPCADVVYERLLIALEGGCGSRDWTVLSTLARPGFSPNLFDPGKQP